MNSKVKTILLVVLLCASAILIIPNRMDQAEKLRVELNREGETPEPSMPSIFAADSTTSQEDFPPIVVAAQDLVNSIESGEYDEIRKNLKKTDYSELSDEEISNFLLNSGLYRVISSPKGEDFYYNILDAMLIEFFFTAMDGDVISNTMRYVNLGTEDYLVTDQIKPCEKEIEKIPIATDLANGSTMNFNDSDEKTDTIEVAPYSFVQDEDGTVCLRIYSEAQEDIIQSAEYLFEEKAEAMHHRNENNRMEWDSKGQVFTIYCDKPSSMFDMIRVMLGSILKQAAEGNSDWHLTFHYYNYETEELIRTDIVR